MKFILKYALSGFLLYSITFQKVAAKYFAQIFKSEIVDNKRAYSWGRE